MDELAQSAMDAVTDGRVKIVPDRYAKGYLDWLGEKRDWPIGRQLWWGHRIPVWNSRLLGCGHRRQLSSSKGTNSRMQLDAILLKRTALAGDIAIDSPTIGATLYLRTDRSEPSMN